MARGGPDYSPYKPIPVFSTGYDQRWEIWQNNVGATGWVVTWGLRPPAGHEYYITSILASANVTGVMFWFQYGVGVNWLISSYFYGGAEWYIENKIRLVSTDNTTIMVYNSDNVIHNVILTFSFMDVTLNP